MPETFKISCGHCGHTVQVDQRAIGKEIPCQRCGKRFIVKAPSSEFITVACTCGKQYKVPASQAGKRAKCNACGSPLIIPGAKPIMASPLKATESNDTSVDIEQAEQRFSPSRLGIYAGAITLVVGIIVLTTVWFSSRTNPPPKIVQAPPAPSAAQQPQNRTPPASQPAAFVAQQPTKPRALTPAPATKPSTPPVVTIIPTPSATTMPTQADVGTAGPISLGELDQQGRPIGQPRELSRFQDDATSIKAVAFSPDGKRIATCGQYLTIRDVLTGKVLQELAKGHSYPSHIIFSPDSTQIFWSSATDRVAWLTDVESGRDLQQFPVENNAVSAMAISHDGKVFATATGTEIQTWDIESGKQRLKVSSQPPSYTRHLMFLLNNRHLLAGGNNGGIYLWDITTGKQIRGFLGHTGHIQALALMPDGKSFFSSAGGHTNKKGETVLETDDAIRQWNFDTGHEIRRLTGHKNWVQELAVSSNGQYLISCSGADTAGVRSEDNSVRIWKISTGQDFFAFRDHKRAVLDVAISPDGRYALSGSSDKTARLWLLPEEVWEDRPADAVVISERRDLRVISRKISGEAVALIEKQKWDEAIALLNESQTDLTELAEQNNLPLWDTTISPLFRLIESKHTSIQTKRSQSANPAEAKATSRPATRLTTKQNHELAEIRKSLAQIEALIRDKKLVQAQKAVYKTQDDLKRYAQSNQVPEWIAPVAVLFQTAAKWQDQIEEARTGEAAQGQAIEVQAKLPPNAAAQQQPQTTQGLQPGQQAPGFTALTLNGGQFATQQFKGKYVLLDFWATWCGPCKTEMPYLADVYQTYGKDKRFVLISLSMDSQIQAPAQYAAQNGMNWVQGFLGSNSPVTKMYQVTGIPSIILIGPDGKVLATRLRGDNIKNKVAEVLGSNKNKVGEVLGSKTTVLHVDLSLEDRARAPIKITSKDNRIVRETNPGRIDLDLSSLPQGNYHFYFGSPGYASQYIRLPDAVVSGVPRQIELFRERYVVMRYVFNKTGGRSLVGDDVENGRAAVSHWGSLEFFGGDWQVWQSDHSGAGFGKIPYLQFHRSVSGFGFLEPPRGRSFDELKEAAESGYQCQNVKAVKGTVLLCRVNGNKPEGLGYGKIMIEDVTETPPRGVTVIQSRAH